MSDRTCKLCGRPPRFQSDVCGRCGDERYRREQEERQRHAY